jgi:hypothetical protein
MRDEATGTVVQDTLTMEVTIAEHGNPGTSSVEELPVGMDDMRLQSGNSTSSGSQSPSRQLIILILLEPKDFGFE